MKTATKNRAKRARPGADDENGAQSGLYVRAVEKAFRVLKVFDGTQSHLSLSEISVLTGLDISAAQRFTHTLAALDFLRRNEKTKKYELSPQLLDFAHHYIASNAMLTRALPYLQQLGHETEEATNLTVIDGIDVVFVLRIVSRNVLQTNFVVGTRLPAYCTAPGLAMLATLPAADADDILERSRPVRHTPNTVIDVRAIKRRLAQIRQCGYAHTAEEYVLGDMTTAAAVTDAVGRAVAAVSVAVSKARWRGKSDEKRYANLVISTAAAISAPLQ
jgi:DNA-binding IclR family transcriptional regulator